MSMRFVAPIMLVVALSGCTGQQAGVVDEDCQNGVDDDHDALVDCDDSDCLGYYRCTCTPGDTHACECSESRSGVATCTNEERWGLCDCDYCGNGLCGDNEDSATCPEDCSVPCGDGVCATDEDHDSCPSDCDPPPPCAANLLQQFEMDSVPLHAVSYLASNGDSDMALVLTASRLVALRWEYASAYPGRYECAAGWSFNLQEFCGRLFIDDSPPTPYVVVPSCDGYNTTLYALSLDTGSVLWSDTVFGRVEAGPFAFGSTEWGYSFYVVTREGISVFNADPPIRLQAFADFSDYDIPWDCAAVGVLDTYVDPHRRFRVGYRCTTSKLSFLDIAITGIDTFELVDADTSFSTTHGRLEWYQTGFWGREFVGVNGRLLEIVRSAQGETSVVFQFTCDDETRPPHPNLMGWMGYTSSFATCGTSAVAFEYDSATTPGGALTWQRYCDDGPLSNPSLVSGRTVVGGRDALYFLDWDDGSVASTVTSADQSLQDIAWVIMSRTPTYRNHGTFLIANRHGRLSCLEAVDNVSGVLCPTE